MNKISKLLLKLYEFTPPKLVIFGVIITVIYYKGLYNDGKEIDSAIEKTNQKIAIENRTAKDSKEALVELETYRANMAGLKEQFNIAAKQLPFELSSSDILKAIDNIAKATNVRVKTKEPGRTEKTDILEKFPMKIGIIGTYSEITQFLYWISSYERITRINHFTYSNITSSTKNLKPGSINFDGEIVSYRFIGTISPGTEAAGVAQPGAKK